MVFLARGGRVSMAQGEDGQMTVPAPTWIRCLGGHGLLKSWRQRRFGGTLGYQFCFVPVMIMWSYHYRAEGPGKTGTAPVVSYFFLLPECGHKSQKNLKGQFEWQKPLSPHCVEEPAALHALLGN